MSHRRVVLVGGPRTGKSTLAHHIASGNAPVHSTDSLLQGHDWNTVARAASQWFNAPGSWVVEGCQSARALRTWLRDHPDQRLDGLEVRHLNMAHQVLTPGQDSLRKAVDTIYAGIKAELSARGAHLTED